MKRILLASVSILSLVFATAQIPKTYTSSEILQHLKKLKVLGSVLYVAAHPDDENTRLIAYLANDKLYRTGYLSLTRGDGGQNLVGDEQGVELGLIRTQELLAARRIDGGEQFFSRAIDFGFSKNPEETFRFWDKEAILNDVVWVIRKFQPDVIIARFPEDSRAGHGQHSASGIMARLGYVAAASADSFPDQFAKGVQVWQAKRMLWNTFNFGGNSTIDSTQLRIDVNDFLPMLGKSVGELAGESRSQHKSQGFGVSRQFGSAYEFFTTIKGAAPKQDLMDGVNTTWDRVPGAEGVDAMINDIIARYNPADPSASVPALIRLLKRLYTISPQHHWVKIKIEEVKKLIEEAAGIYVEAVTNTPALLNGDTTMIRLNMINRSPFKVSLKSVGFGEGDVMPLAKELPYNQWVQTDIRKAYDYGIMETQPYWLRLPPETGMYSINDQQLIGKAENNPLSLTLQMVIDSQQLILQQPVQYRSVDPVKAEQYNPVYFTNSFLLYSEPAIMLFRKGQQTPGFINMTIAATRRSATDSAVIQLTSDSTKFRHKIGVPVYSWSAGDKKTIRLEIPNYLAGTGKEVDFLETSFSPGGTYGKEEFFNARRSIVHDHIPTQTWHYQDRIKVLHIDLKIVGKRIGYIPGAGDRVVEALEQMGYQVTTLNQEDLTYSKLKDFDAVMTGVRAYNVLEYLSTAYDALMEYVRMGGNLIVQYNTNSNIGPVRGRMAPYNMNISRNRITDENAVVQFLLPNHPALNHPNKITGKDFEGWVQERSIYHAEQLDPKFVTPISMADPNEEPNNGALAIAPYGKGNFVYTGLVFFRELPAGVPGAYRLLANLIALPKR